ncbi:MAG: hypothetical protein M3Z46_02575 [Actinomycetota bacterium]|nr:hypothetical protein [Actinomycetota bacterium]
MVAEGSRDRIALRALGDRARPRSLAEERVLPVLPAMAGLVPGAGLQRGASVATSGPCATALALALVAGASAGGSWIAVVGASSLGLLAAAELGVCQERMVLIGAPEPSAWGTVVAALLDAFDVVMVSPEHRVRPADQRRLQARCRERGAVLVLAGGRPDAWPELPELRLTVTAQTWRGLGRGHGHLQARRATVEITGRRQAARARQVELWLPGPDGRVAAAVASSTSRIPQPVPASTVPLREVG